MIKMLVDTGSSMTGQRRHLSPGIVSL